VQAQKKLEFTIFAGSEAVKAVKSSLSGGGNCVLVGQTQLGMVALGDSKDTEQPALTFTPAEWEAFVAGVKSGEFDLSASPSVARVE
jgi:hypothetical protein